MNTDERIERLMRILDPVLDRHGEGAMVVQAQADDLLYDLATTALRALDRGQLAKPACATTARDDLTRRIGEEA